VEREAALASGRVRAGNATKFAGEVGVPRTRVKCHVFVDFDGTIVPEDVCDLLFERFAEPQWREVEQAWAAGRIGSRECMARQVGLLYATRAELLAAIGEIEADPGFVPFVRQCRRRGIEMTVLSDGFDLAIAAVLERSGLALPFWANHLEAVEGNRWRLSFPSARSDCRALAGNCKCAFTAPHATSVKVVIGDGRSDFCIAERADLVFAKGALIDFCRSSGLTHFAFRDFFDVTAKLALWLDGEARQDEGAAGRASSR
jgi:2,3-diketo-5-methylthio-1-phosphopentane phosphatase